MIRQTIKTAALRNTSLTLPLAGICTETKVCWESMNIALLVSKRLIISTNSICLSLSQFNTVSVGLSPMHVCSPCPPALRTQVKLFSVHVIQRKSIRGCGL